MTALQLYWLDPGNPDAPFPDPALALRQPNGLLAMGGDLSTRRLLNAYQAGVFPWYNPEESILWWSPDPRAVFDTNRIHVSRRLRRTMRQADYAVTLDHAFDDVLDGCAAPRDSHHGTWLGPEMQAAYGALHRLGHAHSVEIWRDGALAGGLYGVAIGRLFFGESMFSYQRDASKLALVHLAEQLAAWDFPLIDGQVGSPHLYWMGAFDLSRTEFLEMLRRNRSRPLRPGAWQFDIKVPAADRHMPTDGVND